MKKQILSEEFKRMQKLAGIINENDDYPVKLGKPHPSAVYPAGGAWPKLSQKQFPLYVSDDSKLAPGFIKPKGIGFVMNNNKGTITPEIIQIFNDNYGIIDINYITTFLNNPDNWKAITSEDELNNFMSKYNKIYLISHNGESSELKESLYEAFNPFLDTEEGGYMREYIDDVVEDSMGEPESLDLNYRSDFDIAFDLALTKLKKDQPQLDFDAIEANKESFF